MPDAGLSFLFTVEERKVVIPKNAIGKFCNLQSMFKLMKTNVWISRDQKKKVATKNDKEKGSLEIYRNVVNWVNPEQRILEQPMGNLGHYFKFPYFVYKYHIRS